MAHLAGWLPPGAPPAAPVDLGDCTTLAFPVVLKAGRLAHQSEQNGIRLDLGSPEALSRAYDEMVAELGDGEYVVEEQDQRPHVVEMLVGARTSWRCWWAPAGIVTSGRSSWRGRPSVDIDALAAIVVTVSAAVVEWTALAELEMNPVLVGEAGALAVDALVVPRPPSIIVK